MQRLAPKGVPNLTSHVFAKPRDTGGVAVAPDAAAAAVPDVMRANQASAAPEERSAVVVQERINGRLRQPQRRYADALGDPFLHAGPSRLRGRIGIGEDAPDKKIRKAGQEGAALDGGIEEVRLGRGFLACALAGGAHGTVIAGGP